MVYALHSSRSREEYCRETSPVLFNLCFNTLMVTVADKKYQQLGYLWSTTNSSLHPRAWMQFADDAALIAPDVKGAQALLHLSAAWCS